MYLKKYVDVFKNIILQGFNIVGLRPPIYIQWKKIISALLKSKYRKSAYTVIGV